MNQPILSKRTQSEIDKTMKGGNCRSSEALQHCGSEFMDECRGYHSKIVNGILVVNEVKPK